MIRTALKLGRTPLIRRVLAALILLGAATGSAWWRSGEALSFDLVANVIVALLALIVLHFRWKRREPPTFPKKKTQEIFE